MDEIKKLLEEIRDIIKPQKQKVVYVPSEHNTTTKEYITNAPTTHISISTEVIEHAISQVFSDHLPPKGATSIDVIPKPVSIAPSSTATIIDYPTDRHHAIIWYFGQLASSVDAFDYLKWTFLNNGSEVTPYNPIMGNISGIQDNQLMKLLVPIKAKQSENISLTVENTSTTDTYSCTGRFKGWAYD